MLIRAEVVSVSGALQLIVAMHLDDKVYPKIVSIDHIVPRDYDGCFDYLLENLVGQEVVCFVNRIQKNNVYVCDVHWNKENIAELLIEEGLAD